MSSANTLTGRGGRHFVGASQVARVTQWDINPTQASTTEWGDSDSDGFTNRAAGRKDCTFNSEGKYDSTDVIWDLFQPEDIAEAVLWLGNVASLYWNMPRALCSDFSLTVNVDSEEVIGWSSSWGSDGPYYFPGEAGANAHAYP